MDEKLHIEALKLILSCPEMPWITNSVKLLSFLETYI